ncbi:uncharacterized protein LOC106464815 [Limulus polyphemus]|uniref:Uncharacterized protein LOC106464815 n=1 Tax=Limulus polyphemus TaxID=6850 RepID=A0ABM1SXF0_LIMPO|nr:uncharacterized protein LOC106464815 [Limulus polyphemus]
MNIIAFLTVLIVLVHFVAVLPIISEKGNDKSHHIHQSTLIRQKNLYRARNSRLIPKLLVPLNEFHLFKFLLRRMENKNHKKKMIKKLKTKIHNIKRGVLCKIKVCIMTSWAVPKEKVQRKRHHLR